MIENEVAKFQSDGWCRVSSERITNRIESLIDEILDFSHFVFDENLPVGLSLSEKSDLLSDCMLNFSLRDRKKLSFVYDGIKNLPSFHAYYSDVELIDVCRRLVNSKRLITIKDSVGIRIDLPNEDAQLTKIHQEFHSFPYSLSGLVVWTPLTDVDARRGTLCIRPGSHKHVCRYEGDHRKIEALLKAGRLQEAQKIGNLLIPDADTEPVIVEAKAGDVFFMSALTLHESVPAEDASAARVTCQLRIFDYNDPFHRWKSNYHRFNDGLKQPAETQSMYERYLVNSEV